MPWFDKCDTFYFKKSSIFLFLLFGKIRFQRSECIKIQRMKQITGLLLFTIVLNFSLTAQKFSALEKIKISEANNAFFASYYEEALSIYKSIYNKHTGNAFLNSRIGLSYFFLEEYDDAKIYLIIGSDALSELHKWKDSEKIISCCNIIVLSRIMKNNAPRLNKHLKSHISKDLTMFHSNSYGKIFLEETSMINISSTELRTRLQKKQEISNLMPPLLEQWLLDHKIY